MMISLKTLSGWENPEDGVSQNLQPKTCEFFLQNNF